MLKQFIKYQSLGNDFILFDWKDRSELSIVDCIQHPQWGSYVVKCCDRHRGIGADGVLILKKNIDGLPEMLIFNSDGSPAQICLNGIRCCAHYLACQNPGMQTMNIFSGKRSIGCQIISSDIPNVTQKSALAKPKIRFLNHVRYKYLQIMTHVSAPVYEKLISVSIGERIFNGHCVDVGNPHFVLFEKTELGWLSQHGMLIERHPLFEQKTNVEFVWQENEDDPATYRVLVFERGCGITQSCSSGAVAVMVALHHLGMIKAEQPTNIVMLGGILECTISQSGDVSLKGSADPVFWGKN